MRYTLLAVLSALLLIGCGSKTSTQETVSERLFSDSIAYYSSSYWGFCERDPESGQWSEWDIDSIHPAVVALDGANGRYYTFMLQKDQYSLQDYFNTDSVSGTMIMHPLSNLYQVLSTTSEEGADSTMIYHFWCSSIRLFDGESTNPNSDVTMVVKGDQVMFKVITDDVNWFFDGVAHRDISGPKMEWLIRALGK